MHSKGISFDIWNVEFIWIGYSLNSVLVLKWSQLHVMALWTMVNLGSRITYKITIHPNNKWSRVQLLNDESSIICIVFSTHYFRIGKAFLLLPKSTVEVDDAGRYQWPKKTSIIIIFYFDCCIIWSMWVNSMILKFSCVTTAT